MIVRGAFTKLLKLGLMKAFGYDDDDEIEAFVDSAREWPEPSGGDQTWERIKEQRWIERMNR